LGILPSAKNAWEEHLKDSEGADLSYVGISVFARRIVELSENNKMETFPSVFATVEKLLSDGDEEVKGLMIVGFLESLQNISSWTNRGSKVFVKWLRPKGLQAWKELEIVWEGKSNLGEVLREELNRKQ
jgi:hypothetical protein